MVFLVLDDSGAEREDSYYFLVSQDHLDFDLIQVETFCIWGCLDIDAVGTDLENGC